jgi:LSD1 subclass zinc finger protein
MIIVFLKGSLWTHFKLKSPGAKKIRTSPWVRTQLNVTILLWTQFCIFIVFFTQIHLHVTLLYSYLVCGHFWTSVLRYTTGSQSRKCSVCSAFSGKILANSFLFSATFIREPDILNSYIEIVLHYLHNQWLPSSCHMCTPDMQISSFKEQK